MLTEPEVLGFSRGSSTCRNASVRKVKQNSPTSVPNQSCPNELINKLMDNDLGAAGLPGRSSRPSGTSS